MMSPAEHSSNEPSGYCAKWKARWIVPVDAPPIENGILEITDGIISDLSTTPDLHATNLGNVAIIPGLVNAHTHLEFSNLQSPITPATPFTDWIRALIAHRQSRTETTSARLQSGLNESYQSGSVLLGEIATEKWPEDLTESDIHCVRFRELIGLSSERMAEQLILAKSHLTLEDLMPCESRGLSPHAPYSVHPDLFADLVDLAKVHAVPLAMHLGETTAERELIEHGSGEFQEFLTQMGVWQPGIFPTGTLLDYLEPMCELPTALVIHANYLNNPEIKFLAEHPQLHLVYCPRTHAYFQHTAHPWRKLLTAGASVAIGTDSRGSNPDLSIWRELQFLHERFPAVPPLEILKLGTINGATALGFDHQYGTLQRGKQAECAVVRLATDATDLNAALLAPSSTILGRLSGSTFDLFET